MDGDELIENWYELDPTQYFPALTTLDAFSMDHRLVREFDHETRRRNRKYRDVDAKGSTDPSVFVGLHNTELFGLTRR